MLPLVLAAAVAISAPHSCPPVDPADEITDQRKLEGTDLQAMTTSHPGDGPHGYVSSRVTVFRADCTVAFDQQFEDQGEAALDLVDLAGQPLLIVTTFELGGSACGVEHLVLGYRGKLIRGARDVRVLAPMRLHHSESGGFYVGDLGKGRGPGLAMWDPLAEGEGHSAPHRYRMTIYRWVNEGFSGPAVLTTRRPVAGDDDVPAMLGYSLRDQSDLDRFGGC
jgi:hypothetical protein